MTMVMEQPKPAAKPKPNRALADPWCGVAYVSSEMLGLHDNDRSARRAPAYESSHRHEKSCRCLDCRLYRWQLARSAWRDFESNHGALPPLPAHAPITEREIADWNRIVDLRYARSIARLRRVEQWYAAACSCRTYPPAWMIDDIFGDDETIEEIEESPEPAPNTLAAAMGYVRSGLAFHESEGHIGGEVWPPTDHMLPGETGEPWEVRRAREIVEQAEGRHEHQGDEAAG